VLFDIREISSGPLVDFRLADVAVVINGL
jgi:hypothetical protein